MEIYALLKVLSSLTTRETIFRNTRLIFGRGVRLVTLTITALIFRAENHSLQTFQSENSTRYETAGPSI